MKVLWLTNVPLVKIKKQLTGNDFSTGGWLDGISAELLKGKEVKLFVMCPFMYEKKGNIDGIEYQTFLGTNDKKQNLIFEKVLTEFVPDVIHVFGTEFKHTYNFIRVCEELNLLDKVIISIQGLCHKIAKEYFAGLPKKVINSFTFRDFIKNDNIAKQQKKFIKRGEYEIKALQIAKNVIGRTDWDKACCEQINPRLNYYFCNETLRNAFYNNSWDADKCEKHSIFISQSNYPIKGFHMFLEAMPEILKQFPDAKIYTTGKNLFNLSFKDKIKLNSYQKYIRMLIKKNNLQNRVIFLGFLNENDMCQAYLNSNVFVSASSIENSPNSVGEAMLLGVPTVSSDVGGVKNMLEHGKDGFIYPFDEPYMLAHYVCELFSNKDVQLKFSENAKKHARETHNKEKNLKQLLSIYKKLLGEK